jgi:hypothetical protein
MRETSATYICPSWSTAIAISQSGPPNNQYKFTTTWSGLYVDWVGDSEGAATFTLSIVDKKNYPPAVVWGSFWYPALTTGGAGMYPDTFTFFGSYAVQQGAMPTSPGSLTITVTLSAPWGNCVGEWTGQSVNYS